MKILCSYLFILNGCLILLKGFPQIWGPSDNLHSLWSLLIVELVSLFDLIRLACNYFDLFSDFKSVIYGFMVQARFECDCSLLSPPIQVDYREFCVVLLAH